MPEKDPESSSGWRFWMFISDSRWRFRLSSRCRFEFIKGSWL